MARILPKPMNQSTKFKTGVYYCTLCNQTFNQGPQADYLARTFNGYDPSTIHGIVLSYPANGR